MDQRRPAMDLENLRGLHTLENATSVDMAVAYPPIGDWDFPRRPWQVAMLLLLGIAGAGPIVQSIGRCLEPQSRMSLRYVKRSRILDQESDIDIDDCLVDWVAGECRISLDEAREQIVRLSCSFRLLPMRIVDVVYAWLPWADRAPLASLTWRLSDPRRLYRDMMELGMPAEETTTSGTSCWQ